MKAVIFCRVSSKDQEAIGKHDNAGNKCRDLGLSLYEVSQRGKELFVKKKPDKKRLLLGLIFSTLTIQNGVLTYELTKAFQILAKLVELTNKSTKVDKNEEKQSTTFELNEKIDKPIQIPSFSFLHPEVRRRQDSNLREPRGSGI